jgi:hypothetical protein
VNFDQLPQGAIAFSRRGQLVEMSPMQADVARWW